MPNPPVTITRHPDHLLVKGTWIDYGDQDKHEPLHVLWSMRVPTLRHLDHLRYVLLNPGVQPRFDPGEVEMNGVQDARNLMHLHWWNGAHDEPCELETTAAVSLDQPPWTGTVTLYGWLEDRERLGLARLDLTQAIRLAARLGAADASGLPDGEFVVGRPWFPDPEQIREQAQALKERLEATTTSVEHDSMSAADRSTDPWTLPARTHE